MRGPNEPRPGIGVTATLEARGHAALAARATSAYEEFIAPGELSFRRRVEPRARLPLRRHGRGGATRPRGRRQRVGFGTDETLVATRWRFGEPVTRG
jgi:hypothetical protein